jgi:hypothetical protein
MTTSTHSSNIVKIKEEVIDVKVQNIEGEDLGEIYEVVVDKVSGRALYAVLQSGSFLGLGGKLLALPWNAISYDPDKECFILDVDKERLKNAPGFDKNNWPDMADRSFSETITQYYEKSYMK